MTAPRAEPPAPRLHDESGQASPEWTALVLLAALIFSGLLVAVRGVPAGALANALANRMLCAAHLSDACGADAGIVLAYGEETAALVRRHAPSIAYEDGMRALPVDFRRCRRTGCADGAAEGEVVRSERGRPVAAFVRVIDCRVGAEPNPDADCGGDRDGNLYLQYWLYYPDSATLRGVPVAGERGYHADDWEQYALRIADDGATDARASSHHGYNYEGGARNWASDAGLGFVNDLAEEVGLRREAGWGPENGWLFVSGGSHAGAASGEIGEGHRTTPAEDLRLIPLERVAAGPAGASLFAVSPPWLKEVWRDPEAEGTS